MSTTHFSTSNGSILHKKEDGKKKGARRPVAQGAVAPEGV
jgi:hypothetical protein